MKYVHTEKNAKTHTKNGPKMKCSTINASHFNKGRIGESAEVI